jgi:hypothetical protein
MAELERPTGILNNDTIWHTITTDLLTKDDFDKYVESNDINIKQLQSDNLNINIEKTQIKQVQYQATLEKKIDDMKKHLTDKILDNYEIIEENNSMIDDIIISLNQFKRNYDINNENNRKLFIILSITNIFTFISLILIFITLFTL